MKYSLTTITLISILLSGTQSFPAHAQQDVQSANLSPQLSVVRNAAELESQLKNGSTPLDAFTPYGRREFLRGLKWGTSGLSGFSTSAMQRELNAEQILSLAKWLDFESYIQHLLAEAKLYPPLRLGDPSPELEQRTLNLISLLGQNKQIKDHQTGISRRDFSEIVVRFERDFRNELRPQQLTSLSDSDVVLLFDCVVELAAASLNQRLIDAQNQLFQELKRRQIETRRGINQSMLATMLSQRDFEKARTFVAEHSDLDTRRIPTVKSNLPKNFQGRSAYAYDSITNTLIQHEVHFTTKKRLVMVVGAGCHFSHDALAKISSDPDLQNAARQFDLLILNPPSEPAPLFFIENWNNKHPELPIYVVSNRQEWLDIDRSGVPMFYIFENGKVVQETEGWRGQATVDWLLQALNK